MKYNLFIINKIRTYLPILVALNIKQEEAELLVKQRYYRWIIKGQRRHLSLKRQITIHPKTLQKKGVFCGRVASTVLPF